MAGKGDRAAPPGLVEEAAQWLARMHAPGFSEADRAALERWREQSPAHRQVWCGVEELNRHLAAVPPGVGRAVLERPRAAARRRLLLKSVAAIAIAPPLGWLAHRSLRAQGWGSDFRTAVGERRTLALPDGGALQLNTASAVDLEFDAAGRVVRHVAGEILVRTGHAARFSHRPFMVHTPQGRLRALGTRFIVRVDGDRTRLTVLEGAVRVSPAASAAERDVQAGEELEFGADGFGAIRPAPPASDAWSNGVLYAEDMRLADFTRELARYRSGLLRCDPAVAEVRVTGAFQLEDTDRILQLVAQTLPVRVQRRSDYWVTFTRP